MTINLQTGGYTAPQPIPGVRSTEVQLGTKTQPAVQPAEPAVPVLGNNASIAATAEEKRQEQVVFAAKSIFKDVYAVSDKNFTIFKDATGQYVTRYTSLRDGKVTYIPELKLMQLFENQQGSQLPMIELKV